MKALVPAVALVLLTAAQAPAQDGPLPASADTIAQLDLDQADQVDRVEDADRIDRILAIVDEDPILASDVDRVIGLGLAEPARQEGADSVDAEGGELRRVLDQLIEERLRFHEIDRFGFTEISLDEVDQGFEAIREGFRSTADFDARLAELGLNPEGLRQLVARQIMVLTYVEERLGSRVFVSLDEIRQYYADTLEPAMKAQGQSAPPLAEVREQIRAVVKQERLNEEIDRWTEELRLEADVEDFLDSPLEELPEHLLDTIE